MYCRFQNRRYKCKRLRQDRTLELTAQMQPARRVNVPVLIRDGKPCLADFSPWSATGGSQVPGSTYLGYPVGAGGPSVLPMQSTQSPFYNGPWSATGTPSTASRYITFETPSCSWEGLVPSQSYF